MGDKPGRWLVINAVVAAWLIYDLASATEAQPQAVLIMEYVGLGLCLFGLVGSLIALARQSGS